MARLLSIAFLVLMVVLLIPTGLVLASQNSLPGQAMYPVKRQLENSIITIASLTPWTKAYFQVDFSKRRFKEAEVLLSRKENATVTLNELIAQSEEAGNSINSVSGLQKKQLRDQLISQLAEYNQALVAYRTVQPQIPQSSPEPVIPVPSPQPSRSNSPTPSPSPQPARSTAPVPSPSLRAPVVVPSPSPIDDTIARIEKLIKDQEAQRILDEATTRAKADVRTPSPSPSVREVRVSSADVGPAKKSPSPAPQGGFDLAGSAEATLPAYLSSEAIAARSKADPTAEPQGSVYCSHGGVSTDSAWFNWNMGKLIVGKTVASYTLTINKAPDEWAPDSSTPPNIAVDGDRAIFPITGSTQTVALMPGNYVDWTVRIGFTDGTISSFIPHFGAFICPPL